MAAMSYNNHITNAIIAISIACFTWSSLYYFCIPGHHSLEIQLCTSLFQSMEEMGEVIFGVGDHTLEGYCKSSSLGCGRFMSGITLPLMFLSCLCFFSACLKMNQQMTPFAKIYRGKWKWLTRAKDIQTILFSGDTKIRLLTIVFLVVPVLMVAIFHPLYGLGLDDLFKPAKLQRALANPTGIGSIVALSFFLVPVARQSPLLVACGVNPIQALQMHICAGRLCLILSVMHGVLYLFIYVEFGKNSGKNAWQSMSDAIFPPKTCWHFVGPMNFKNTGGGVSSHGGNHGGRERELSFMNNCAFAFEGYNNTVSEENHHGGHVRDLTFINNCWLELINDPNADCQKQRRVLSDCKHLPSSTSEGIEAHQFSNNTDWHNDNKEAGNESTQEHDENSSKSEEKDTSQHSSENTKNNNSASSERECYGYYRNFTGFISVMALVLLSLSSLNRIRRWSYRVFYYSHVVLGWIMLIFAILHWGAAGLYILPSVIYYFACTMPVVVQMAANYFLEGGVRITQTTLLKNSNKCVEMIFSKSQAAHLDETKYSGPYVRLCVPELSLMWHPFTVASSSDDPTKLKLLFRALGPFTDKLYKRLEKCALENEGLQPPTMLIDGYYGSQDWASQAMKHDSVLMVAGGIGVTPFLSMLAELHTRTSNCKQEECKDDYEITTKQVTFHWYCRDEGLIRHVLKHHLRFLTNNRDVDDGIDTNELGACACTFDVVIHYTARELSDPTPFLLADEAVDIENCSTEESDNRADGNNVIIHRDTRGVDMEGSHFSITRRYRFLFNFPSLVVFAATAISGVVIQWQQNVDYVSHYTRAINLRAYALYIILAISMLVGLLGNMFWYIPPNLLERIIKYTIKWRKRNYEKVGSSTTIPVMCFERSAGSTSSESDSSSDDGSGDGTADSGPLSTNCIVGALGVIDPMSNSSNEAEEIQSPTSALEGDKLNRAKTPIYGAVGSLTTLPHQSYINGTTRLSIQVNNGRPIIDNVIQPVIAGVIKPALFLCGPLKLLNDVKKGIRKKTLRCCVYEEEFEM